MSTTAISQVWKDDEHRTWIVQLTVTGADLTGDDIADLGPVVAAIETWTARFTTDTDREAAP